MISSIRSAGSIPEFGPNVLSLPLLIQKSAPGEPWNVSLPGSLARMPKPGIRPVPWPCSPYFLPCSDPVVTKSIWSWYGFSHGGNEVVGVAAPAGGVLPLSQMAGASDAGNCRSTDPPHRLGPIAPQPDMACT